MSDKVSKCETIDYLLTCVAEECSEVSKEAIKGEIV